MWIICPYLIFYRRMLRHFADVTTYTITLITCCENPATRTFEHSICVNLPSISIGVQANVSQKALCDVVMLSAVKAIVNTENFGPKTKEKEEIFEAMPSIRDVNPWVVFLIHHAPLPLGLLKLIHPEKFYVGVTMKIVLEITQLNHFVNDHTMLKTHQCWKYIIPLAFGQTWQKTAQRRGRVSWLHFGRWWKCRSPAVIEPC